MEKRDIIIALILEDMKHNILINGLHEIGLTDNDKFTLSLDLIIAKLMNIQTGKITDEWLTMYQVAMLNINNLDTQTELKNKATLLYKSLTKLKNL